MVMKKLIDSYKRKIDKIDENQSDIVDSVTWDVHQGTKDTYECVVDDLEKYGDDLLAKAEQMEVEQLQILEMSYGNDIQMNQDILTGIQRIIQLIKRQTKGEK